MLYFWLSEFKKSLDNHMNNPFKTSRLEIRVREKYNSNIFVFYCNFTFNLVVSTVVMVKKNCVDLVRRLLKRRWEDTVLYKNLYCLFRENYSQDDCKRILSAIESRSR